ncbi:HU family DNA-binding protein [Porphyromonas pogonae]|uniref:HU family DNA-binding protein n=1 Tax=Porphyromonas pogonae TaxID=867595 RepID=UPI002E7A6BC2|nr:HU family DNA-binding protein [Porphyromonas pogonae]
MLFTVEKRKALVGKLKGKTVYYAKPAPTQTLSLRTIANDIADSCSLTAADVEATLHRLSYVMKRELMSGKRINLGDLGIFSVSFRSQFVEKADDVDARKIKKPRVVLRQNKEMRMWAKDITLAVEDPKNFKTKKPGDHNPDPGNPGNNPGSGL